MKTEKKFEKERDKEIKALLKENEQRSQQEEKRQSFLRQQSNIYEQISQFENERENFIRRVVQIRKTDPETAKILIAEGSRLDLICAKAKKYLAMADSHKLRERAQEMITSSLAMMCDLCSNPITYKTQSELRDLEKKKQYHDAAVMLRSQSQEREWSIYTGDLSPESGAGSAFESDVNALERQLAIEEFDEE